MDSASFSFQVAWFSWRMLNARVRRDACPWVGFWWLQEVEYFSGADARGSAVVNFGWPCFEGSYANPSNLDWLRYGVM